MRLSRLRLHNHRNYAQLDLSPGPGVNVFIGPNGQGKTNLLEAVAMLALSSSPRARRDSELVGPVATGSRIAAEIETGGLRRELAITLAVEGERAKRTIEVDGARRRAFDLPGNFRVVLFWPDDLGLIKGGPELRRRFLNQMLVQVEPGALELMRSYAASDWTILRKVRIPNALPYFFTAMKIATTLSLIGAIVGEYFGGANSVLGRLIVNSASALKFDITWAAILFGAATGIAFYLGVVVIERLAIPWAAAMRADS